MSGCDPSKCKSCSCNDSCEPKEKLIISTKPQEESMRDILETKIKYGPKPDVTPLSYECKHWQYSNTIYRYQCLECIRSWVWGVGAIEAEKELVNYKNKTIASERIERAIKEYKYDNEVE